MSLLGHVFTLSLYFKINVLLLSGYLIVGYALPRLMRRIGQSDMSFNQGLKLKQWLFVSLFLVPTILQVIPSESFIQLPSHGFSRFAQAFSQSPYNSWPNIPSLDSIDPVNSFSSLSHSITEFFELGILVSLFLLLRQVMSMVSKLKKYSCIRRIGSVSVLVSDEVRVPYSVRFLKHAYVVLPYSFLHQRDDFKISLVHELQHHRNLDTLWVYVFEVLRCVCFWNPFVYLWIKELGRIQEFACDEAIIGRKRVSPHAYTSCLFRVAKIALESRFMPVGTAGMARALTHSVLRRRIEMIFNSRKKLLPSWMVACVGTGAFATVIGISLLAKAGFAREQITLNEAQSFAAVASQDSTMPINMNPLVLKQLNYFVGTENGRKFVREALARLAQFRPLFEKEMKNKVPLELLAMPVVETGVRNLPQGSGRSGAGFWGFIKSTAIRYKLIVSDAIDERLNVKKETVAAVEYLSDLFLIFQDWRLSVKAYNEGETQVLKLIDTYKTRDPWEIELKQEGPENYLSQVTAMIIIMKNPDLQR